MIPSLTMGIDYVGEKAAALARKFEKTIQHVAKQAGILFVGVRAVPTQDGESDQFEVSMGIRRGIGVTDGNALVKFIFRKEIEDGLRFQVSSFQGVSGADRDYDGDEETRSSAS